MRVVRLALAFDAFCAEIEPGVLRRARAINDQLQRASASLLANVGEGLDSATRAEKRAFFGYAHRSAGEAERLLEGAHARSAITAADRTRGLRLLRDAKMDLQRLIRWTHRPT